MLRRCVGEPHTRGQADERTNFYRFRREINTASYQPHTSMQAGKQAEKLKHAIEIDEDKDINIKIIIVKANPRNQIIMVTVLPNRGSAKIKSVLSGDTVILLGRAAVPGGMAPEVTFTFERVTAPRLASKSNNNVDDPGAFSSREWLRNLCVGKTVTFETR